MRMDTEVSTCTNQPHFLERQKLHFIDTKRNRQKLYFLQTSGNLIREFHNSKTWTVLSVGRHVETHYINLNIPAVDCSLRRERIGTFLAYLLTVVLKTCVFTVMSMTPLRSKVHESISCRQQLIAVSCRS
jgi:hypothetical protein